MHRHCVLILLFTILIPIQGNACVSGMESIDKNIEFVSMEPFKYDEKETLALFVRVPMSYKGWEIHQISIERDDEPYLTIPLRLKDMGNRVSSAAKLPKSLLQGAEIYIAYGDLKCTQAFKTIKLNPN